MADIGLLPTLPAPSPSGGGDIMSILGLAASNSPPGALLAAGSQVLGTALGRSNTSSADANRFSSSFDSSNWNVNFGAGSISSEASKKTGEGGADWLTVGAGVLALALLVRAWKS